MRSPTRRRRYGACLAIGAMVSSLFAVMLAPPASAAPVETWVDCSAAGNPFKLPINMDGSSVPASVFSGDNFDATINPDVVLTQEWIQGALIVGYTVFETAITEVNVTNVRVRVPTPAGATAVSPVAPSTAAYRQIDWAVGNLTVGTVNPSFDPLLPPSETNLPSIATGSFNLVPPAPAVQTYTATGAGGSDIDFELGVDPLRIDLLINGALPLPISCSGVATEIEDPSVIPQTDPPTLIPFTQSPFLTVPIDELPVPTANISSVSGQVVTTAARAGNTITFGGPNWSPSTAINARLCSLDLLVCDPAGLNSIVASIDGAGVLSGTAVVDPSAATGARKLLVSTDQSEEDSNDILILGAPTINAPGNGGLGAPITITGTNWNPNSPSTAVQFLNATGDTVLGQFLVTVNSTGSFSTVQNVVADMGIIAAGEANLGYPQPPGPSTPGSLWALQAGFQISANECTVLGSDAWATGGPVGQSCSIEQTVLLDVLPGALAMSQTNGIIDLGQLQLNGQAQVVPGAINQITVVDATGSLFGWDLTATMSDLVNAPGATGNNVIPAGNMEWTPSCDPIDANLDGIIDGDGTEVASGAVAVMDNTVANTLCTAAIGGGGGTFTGDAGLELLVPANVAAGDYTATMVFLLM